MDAKKAHNIAASLCFVEERGTLRTELLVHTGIATVAFQHTDAICRAMREAAEKYLQTIE